jgi:thiosulfate reductase cytochrome b subunit
VLLAMLSLVVPAVVIEGMPSLKAFARSWRLTDGHASRAVILLLWTGLEVRGTVRAIGFETSVRLHEALGFFLLANAFLGLFYFLTSGAIRQYVAEPRDFATLAFRQAAYYLRGIFRGAPHPVERTARARLNPLQKAVYVGILNVLLPWQVLTGLAMWGLERSSRLASITGGLGTLAPLHVLGAWLFAAFLVAHVYLTTTSGRRPLSGIYSMVTGGDDVPAGAAPSGKEATS